MGNTAITTREEAEAKIEQLTKNVHSLEFELKAEQKKIEDIQDYVSDARTRLQNAENKSIDLQIANKKAADKIRELDAANRACLEEKKQLQILVSSTKPQTCMREYRVQKRIGKGGYGTVDAVCKEGDPTNKDCKYAMKIQKYLGQKTDDEIDIALYVQKKLPTIVATIHNHWKCGAGTDKKYYIVSDRYDLNMDQVGFRQRNHLVETGILTAKRYPINRIQYVYTESQLLQMLAIAELLTNIGVVHADLKNDNFLYLIAADKVVVTDFGLAGFLRGTYSEDAGLNEWLPPTHGFSSHGRWSCGQPGSINERHALFRYLDILNLWQISTCMLELGALIDTGPTATPRFFAFTGANFGSRTRDSLALTQSCRGDGIKNQLPLNLRALEEMRVPKYVVTDAKIKETMKNLTRR